MTHHGVNPRPESMQRTFTHYQLLRADMQERKQAESNKKKEGTQELVPDPWQQFAGIERDTDPPPSDRGESRERDSSARLHHLAAKRPALRSRSCLESAAVAERHAVL